MADKGWSREECRDRYVRGPRIGLRALAELSGVPFQTLGVWSRQDAWPEQRRQFQDSVKTLSDKKVREQIASQAVKLSVEHLSSYSRVRRIADCLLRQIESKVIRLESSHPELADPEIVKEQLKELMEVSNIGNINLLSLVLDRAIQGERNISGAEYEDLQKAANALKRRGFQITVAEGTELIRIPGGQEVQPEDLMD